MCSGHARDVHCSVQKRALEFVNVLLVLLCQEVVLSECCQIHRWRADVQVYQALIRSVLAKMANEPEILLFASSDPMMTSGVNTSSVLTYS